MSRRGRRCALLLALLGGGLLAHGLYLPAKAAVAQALLLRAWERSLAVRAPVPPWPWADTWPVARLSLPSRGMDLIVLSGSSGRTLAFGPGHVAGTARPGSLGVSVLAGHRDTHFRFLRELGVGERIVVTTAEGSRTFRVVGAEIADSRRDRLGLEAAGPVLALVTCYPFDALRAGGPLRFVVTAVSPGDVPADNG